jgi:hypothetical protein
MYYILDKEKNPYKVGLDQVINNLDSMRGVKKDTLPNGVKIETIFTFYDLNKENDRPFLFSTKVYVDNTHIYSEKYQTYKEAVSGHKLVLEKYNENI